MDLLEPYSIFSFPTDYKLYKGIACDGCFFYFTMPKSCRIYKFSMDFLDKEIIEVNRPFSCICYDNSENCFWTSAEKINTLIFKLDCNMNEIDYIQFNSCKRINSRIVGLSYNCEKNSLLIAFSESIAEISMEGGIICLQTAQRGCYNAVLSIAPYYVVSLLRENMQIITIYSCDGSQIKTFCFPKIYKIEDIIFCPCDQKNRTEVTLNILATKHCCYPRLLQCRIDAAGMALCCSNYECCHITRPGNKCSDQCVTDIIESIALMETSLSHILNALGEKLQKACQISNTIYDLMEINNAVNKTVMNITQLEHILYAKLDMISSLNEHMHAPFQ